MAHAMQHPSTYLYENQNYKYSIQVPDKWQAHDHGDGVVVFNSPHAQTTVNIQTIFTKKAKGHYENVKALMDDFVSQVPKHTQHAKFTDRKPIVLTLSNGTKLIGESIILTFFENDVSFKQWQVMLINQDGRLFQAFAYRAPVNDYDLDYKKAMTMFASWNIDS